MNTATETIIPVSGDEWRLIRVQFPDLAGPALVEIAPIVAWRVPAEYGDATPVTPFVVGMNIADPDAGIEGPFPGVLAHGQRFATQVLWIESRRDALRAAVERKRAGHEHFGPGCCVEVAS